MLFAECPLLLEGFNPDRLRLARLTIEAARTPSKVTLLVRILALLGIVLGGDFPREDNPKAGDQALSAPSAGGAFGVWIGMPRRVELDDLAVIGTSRLRAG